MVLLQQISTTRKALTPVDSKPKKYIKIRIMKQIDIRLNENEVSLLHSMIGKEFSSFLHDEFNYTQSSTQVIELIIAGKSYYIYSFTEEKDYFGSPEDVAVWTVSDEKLPVVEKKSFIKTTVNETIIGISLIQENQKVFENGEQTYDVLLTRGIVFDLGDRQIAFEKDIWFSEEIIVHRGYNLTGCFSSTENFGDDWDKSLRTECIRKEIIIQ